uniref:Uncharacterized protein n=1 Tax=Onchocerca volvulus TaxID=6282 RepID=A0A8R1TZ35_ONCVO
MSLNCLSYFNSVISIIITLCFGSIQSFQSAENKKSLEDENDQWLLHLNHNYGLFFFNLDGTPTFEMLSVYKLMIICFAVIQCQKLSHHGLDRFISGRGLVKNDWVVEDEDENCDTVEKAPWSRYFFRGMIFGFLIGLSGGILIGFFCWKIRVYKENYNL